MSKPLMLSDGATFGAMLRLERERRQLSCEEMSAELKVPPKNFQKWESGERTPRLQTAMRWASMLGFRLYAGLEP